MSLRDLIIAADDLPSEDVLIPEWNATIRVVGLSGEGRANYIQLGMDENGDTRQDWLKHSTPRLLIETVYDPETGEPAFTESDVDAINSKNAAVLDRIATIATRLSGIGGDPKTKEEEADTAQQFR